MKIVDKPLLSISDEPGVFILASSMLVVLDNGEIIYIPKGFKTDLASIPGILQWIPGFSVNGPHRIAAVLHDYLYTVQGLSRAECDKIFLEAMIACNVNKVLRNSIYAGVRVGGWVAWNHRRDEMRSDMLKYFEDNGLSSLTQL